MPMKTTKAPPSTEKPQIEKFREAAHELETDDREEAFDAKLRRIASSRLDAKVCPECGHFFQGNGWDGIDAHWRARHDHVMPYAEAWPLIKSGQYESNKKAR